MNLEFFLTDHNSLIKPQQLTVDAQTDPFLKKPPSPKYVPKKTGIDTATQVEDVRIFACTSSTSSTRPSVRARTKSPSGEILIEPPNGNPTQIGPSS